MVEEVDKDWGYEIWLANNEKENYCGKILYINEGKSTSIGLAVVFAKI